MSAPMLEDLSTPDLHGSVTVQEATADKASTLTVCLIGSAEASSTEPLQHYFSRVHQAALDGKVSDVCVDLRGLEFMTSACLKQFLTWFRHIESLPTDDRYKVRLLGSKKRPWQGRSLHAIVAFCVDLISVEWTG
jgi:hypothetical protein